MTNGGPPHSTTMLHIYIRPKSVQDHPRQAQIPPPRAQGSPIQNGPESTGGQLVSKRNGRTRLSRFQVGGSVTIDPPPPNLTCGSSPAFKPF